MIAFAAAVSAAVMLSLSQRPLYQATTQVFINRANIVSAISGVTDPSTVGNDPTRFIATQSDVARSLTLAKKVVAAAGVRGLTAGQLLAASSVTPGTNADVLNFAVSNPHAGAAIRLTNAYAEQYSAFKTDLDTKHITHAVATLKSRIAAMASSGVSPSSPAYATLLQNESQLETLGRILANNAQVLAHADVAQKIRPRPKRNALLGGLIGIVVGIGLAFLAEALDRRVRSSSEAETALRLPLLARVPRPPRGVEKADRPVMLAKPIAPEAEPFRRLRANLEFVNLDHRARKILVTSAAVREGKSTTVANLAIALARAGRNVALVDLDLRKPALHKLFGLTTVPGITDVVLKHVKLSDALRTIDIARRPAALNSPAEAAMLRRTVPEMVGTTATLSNGRAASLGKLKLVPAGTIIPDPGEVIDDDRLTPILTTLAEQFDYVLLDAPPFLAVGDAPALSARVDGIVVVARLGVVSAAQLHDLAHQLETCQAAKLGFVAAGADVEARYDNAGYYHAAAKADHVEHSTPN